MTYGASGIWVIVLRGRRINFLIVQERSRRLLFHEDFRDRAEAIRAKARLGSRLSRPRPDQGFQLVKTNDMFPLPSAWTYEAGLPSEARILGFWDSAIPVISGTGTDTICSFSPRCGPGEPMSVPRCCISTYYFVDGPYGPGLGLGSRPRLSGRYFKDLGAYLRCDIAD